MNKLNVSLEHCFGITRLNYEFDFSECNIVAIYARNGLMKTSFAKTFRKLQENKANEIRDEIFDTNGNASVSCDEIPIHPENIFVIKSFESSYEADVTPLLINTAIKEHLKDVLEARDKLFKALEKCSGLKIKKTLGGKPVYELEAQIIADFGFEEDSFLVNVSSLRNAHPQQFFLNVPYADLFDQAVLKKYDQRIFKRKFRSSFRAVKRYTHTMGFLKKDALRFQS